MAELPPLVRPLVKIANVPLCTNVLSSALKRLNSQTNRCLNAHSSSNTFSDPESPPPKFFLRDPELDHSEEALVLSSISSAWWYTGVSVAALPSTWRRTVFRSLQLPPGSICVLLFVISWRYRLTASARMVVGLSQLPARRRGTHCQHIFVVWRTTPLHLDDYLRLICFLSTSVCSALGFSAIMRYINRRFTYFSYLLTCCLHQLTILTLLVHPSAG